MLRTEYNFFTNITKHYTQIFSLFLHFHGETKMANAIKSATSPLPADCKCDVGRTINTAEK